MQTNANIPINEEMPKENILQPIVDVICEGFINRIYKTNDINIKSFSDFENSTRMYLNEPMPMGRELPSIQGTHTCLGGHLFFYIVRISALAIQLQCLISVFPITSRVQLPSHFPWISMLPHEEPSFNIFS